MTENNSTPLYGGIEGGGTKFNCIVASGPDGIVAETRIPTTTPKETLSRTIDFFKPHLARLQAIGFACFGPLDLDPNSDKFGYLTSTPKPGWSNTNLLTPLQDAFGLPVALDTDVNGAALAEYLWGAAQGLDTFIYLTIGTGIGGGAMLNGQLLHGLTHPEMGHILLPQDQSDTYKGFCPFHQNCFESLAAGPAIQGRWGKPAQDLPPEHPAWQLEAHYISIALASYITTLSPQKIILGGGVMKAEWLFPLIRQAVQENLNKYIIHPKLQDQIVSYIVPPGLGSRAGVMGAVGLAQQAMPPTP
jgi:fructokinase